MRHRSPSAAENKTRPEAFTLIELLLVIAIIAILASLLLPVLTNAKQQALAITCRNNERNLVLAWSLYHLDSADRIVRAHDLGKMEYDWVGPKQNAAGTATGAGGTLDDEIRGLKDGMLWTYLTDPKVYHCAVDKRDYLKNWNGPKTYRSYAIAASMNGGPYAPEPIVRFSQLRTPASKYVFIEEDTDVSGVNWGAWVLPCPFTDAWWDPIAVRHGKTNCLAFADGHVELHKWVDPRTLKMSQGQVFGLPTPNSRDLKYMQTGYAHLTINP